MYLHLDGDKIAIFDDTEQPEYDSLNPLEKGAGVLSQQEPPHRNVPQGCGINWG
jgi:hypothetical protein